MGLKVWLVRYVGTTAAMNEMQNNRCPFEKRDSSKQQPALELRPP